MARMILAGLVVAPGFILSVAAQALLPPPPIVTVPASPAGPPREQGLLMWTPGPVACAGGTAPVVQTIRRPLNRLIYPLSTPAAPVRLRFAVDRDGRTLSIEREPAEGGAGLSWFGDDIAPALAASRFAPGSPASACTITYTPRFAAAADAPVAELVSYSVTPVGGRLPQAGWDRIGAKADCFQSPQPQPLLRAYPDFAAIPATPGVRDWSLVSFDIDARGQPVRLARKASNGNAALDRAAIQAVATSRFAGGARTGCSYPYWRNPGLLAAPPTPAVAEPDEGPCARTGNWAVEPRLVYPATYRARAIEGWAMLSYDVATWGQIGNVRIIEAQPSAEFGTAAKTMLEAARRPEGPGATGCQTRVLYRIAGEGAPSGGDGAGQS